MKTSGLNRYALAIGAASALLVGCGGSQPPIGSPGAMSQSRATTGHADRGRSWILPGTSTGSDLLYVATAGGIKMLTYPKGKSVGELPSHAFSPFVCADPNSGDVFVVGLNRIDEYPHGGTSAIATLTPPSGDENVAGCSVDPVTGNFAVVVYQGYPSSPGAVLIYQNATGTPVIYQDPTMSLYYYCGYDNQGNLYVVGLGYGKHGLQHPIFTELPKGGGSFTDITITGEYVGFARKVQWDGSYLALHSGAEDYRVQVSGSTGTVVSFSQFQGDSDTSAAWIQGNTFIGRLYKVLRHNEQSVGYWDYPAGGSRTKLIKGLTKGKHDNLSDLTISVAPSR